MKVLKTRPLRNLSFEGFFETLLFWKKDNDPLIEKLSDICMFGFNYESPVFKTTEEGFVTLEEFMEASEKTNNKRTVFQKILDKYNNLDKSINIVKIEDHDLWSLDDTLATIIHPALIKLKALNDGIPYVDDEDVPEELQTKSDNREDNYCIKKWHYVLDQMIYSFDSDVIDEAYGDDSLNSKIQNGHRLFGKYYTSLWT